MFNLIYGVPRRCPDNIGLLSAELEEWCLSVAVHLKTGLRWYLYTMLLLRTYLFLKMKNYGYFRVTLKAYPALLRLFVSGKCTSTQTAPI